jgi:plasmid stabilization system protein ParE
MRRLRVFVSDKARADLAEIRAYYHRVAGPVVAKRILTHIRTTFAAIARAPRAGSIHSEFGGEVRLRNAPPYVVYVEIFPDRAEILRVLHHARDRDAIIRREGEKETPSDED